MEITKLIVPNGIRYISDWSNYSLEYYQFPHILNKTLTGCGFTEYCIRNPLNVILCSPRRILLENKEDQHKGNVYYVRNDVENQTNFEKDFTTDKVSKSELLGLSSLNEKDKAERILQLKDSIRDYYSSCRPSPFNPGRPCKILVTYDSFRHVKEALGERINDFYVVIDEMQSIFCDAKFKSNTELEFVEQVKDLSHVCFVSATPMLTKYLEMLDYFKDLPYYELDWASEEPGRIIKPTLNIKHCGKGNTIQANIKKIIESYKAGQYEVYRYKDENGLLQQIESKEAVIYVNSVKDITKAIKGSNLTIDQCNVLCADIPENRIKIRRAFNGRAKDGISYIGKVPKLGEKHKMFTFCTRTVYLGADFYSTNARTFIFSNANIDSLSVDVSMDLPQILGRQRLIENPWKNSADLYVVLKYKEKSKQDFIDYMNKKDRATESLLKAFSLLPDDDKDALAEKYEIDAKNSNYKRDYVAVNHHNSSNRLPIFNNLMRVAELRTFEIQEYDYKDRFAVFSKLNDKYKTISNNDSIDQILSQFRYSYTTYTDKMKYLCNQKSVLSEEEFKILLTLLPDEYSNFLSIFTVEEISSCKYRKADLKEKFNSKKGNQGIEKNLILQVITYFQIGQRYSKSEIKEKLKEIYKNLGYNSTPKASDIEQWFEVKSVLLSENGKRVHGFEIIKKKGD